MNKSFSLYLDVIRFLAALAVFLDHLSTPPFTKNPIFWRLEGYGNIAVTIFFVLSGYVIAYVTDVREKTPAEYFSARIARIYSVVGIALILTIVLDKLGITLNPDFYAIQRVLWKPESWAGYLSSAVFLNEYQIFGFNGISPGTNGPFWSLSFEVTYYVLAGLILFAPKRYWIPAAVILLGMAGRTIVALLPIWMLGFLLYHSRRFTRVPAYTWLLLSCASAGIILALPTLLVRLPSDNFGAWFPWGRAPFNRNLLQDYVVAFVFAVHLISVRSALSESLKIPGKITTTVRWLGSQTFPLYCFHYPAICFFASISPWGRSTLAHTIFVLVCTLTLIAALVPLCERLKRDIRNACIDFFRKLPGSNPIVPKA